MIDEKWKEVELKNVTWIVSDKGRIASKEKTVTTTRIRKGIKQKYETFYKSKILSNVKTKGGYLEVSVQNNGKRVRALVHRLVGVAFVDKCDESLSINHINGIKTDNRPENLEWVSLARNTQHQWETGLVNLRGENHPSHKLTSKQVVYIRKLLQQGIPAHTLSVIAGVSDSIIYLIKDGKRWSSLSNFD